MGGTGGEIIRDMTSVALMIVTLGLFAVLVSKRSDTRNILTAAGNAFSGAIGAAQAPVTGGQGGGYGGGTFGFTALPDFTSNNSVGMV